MCCDGMKWGVSVQALPVSKVITKKGRVNTRNSRQKGECHTSVLVDLLSEKDLSKGRLLQKVFGHYLWHVKCHALSLLFSRGGGYEEHNPTPVCPFTTPLSLSPQLY